MTNNAPRYLPAFIADSEIRDSKLHYGDSLQVTGISAELDGTYIIRDTMNRRIKNTIDILVGKDDKIMGHWKNVQITKFETVVVSNEVAL